VTIRVRRAKQRKAFVPVDAPPYQHSGLSGYGAIEPALPTTNYKAWAIGSGIGAVLFGIAAALLPASKAVRVGCGIAAAGLAGGAVYGGVKASEASKPATFAASVERSMQIQRAASVSIVGSGRMYKQSFALSTDRYLFSGYTGDGRVIFGADPVPGAVEVRPASIGVANERFGGIDLSMLFNGDSTLGRFLIHLRPRILAKGGYDTCVGWQNRMPYDVGHINRRWWATNIKIKKRGGTTESTTVHDNFNASENPRDFILSDLVATAQFRQVREALTEALSRWGAFTFPITPYTNNETVIGEGHGNNIMGGLASARLLADLSQLYMMNPNYVMWINQGNNNGPKTDGAWDDLSHTIQWMYSAPAYRNGYAMAGRLWSKVMKVFYFVLECVFSIFGLGDVVEVFLDTIVGKILTSGVMDWLTSLLDIAVTIEQVVGALKGQATNYMGRINGLSDEVRTASGSTAAMNAYVQDMIGADPGAGLLTDYATLAQGTTGGWMSWRGKPEDYRGAKITVILPIA
jgi:hypothetical protein